MLASPLSCVAIPFNQMTTLPPLVWPGLYVTRSAQARAFGDATLSYPVLAPKPRCMCGQEL
jgi:hypothetical protein